MCKRGEKQLNKINMFFKKYKIMVIVYSSIFIIVLIIYKIEESLQELKDR